MSVPIRFPRLGAANVRPYIEESGDTCPPEAILNVRAFVPEKDRARGGQRPGIIDALDFDFGDQFQAMATVSRASFVSGYQSTACAAIDGISRSCGTLQGQVWWILPNLSMYHDFYDDSTSLGGTGTESVNCIAVSKTQPRVAWAYTVLCGPNTIVKVAVYNPNDGELQWEATITEAGVNRYVNTVAFGQDYLYVTSNAQVWVYDAMTGSQIGLRDLGAGGDELASECIQAVPWYDTGTGHEYLFVAFNGIDTASTLPNTGETIQGGDAASMFRSAVAKFLVGSPTDFDPGSLDYVQYGAVLSPADTYWEYAHKTMRVSETTAYRPHGCWITSLAVASDGTVAITRTNQGWGPNKTFYTVNGSQAGYVTVMVLDPDGRLLWESDTDSLKTAGYDAGNNDIPSGAGDDPSLLASAFDSTGNLYVAGRRNAAGVTDGANVFYFYGPDGSEFWRANLSGTIRQAAAAIDPTDDNPWFAGDRNLNWTGSAGEYAHLWKLNRLGGAVLRSYYLVENVSGLGVCVDSRAGYEGRVMFCTDYVS